MVYINILIIFIAGFIFCQWLLPLGDALLSILLQKLEALKTNIIYGQTQVTCQIHQLQDQDQMPEENSRAIGFTISHEEEYEDDDNI